MGDISLSVSMRPAALLSAGAVAGEIGVLAVRVAPWLRDIDPPVPGTLWAWGLVESIAGREDRIVIGGPAASYEEAGARGKDALDRELARRARR